MSSVDTAWLRMDRPTNPMMIVAVLMTETPIGFGDLKEILESRLLPFPRFRQKAVERTMGFFWEMDEDFELDFHLQRIALPGAAGQEELQEFVGRLASTPLDPQRPLWQFHLVERYNGGSALVARIHHSIGDGIALVKVMLSLTDEAPEGWLERPRSRRGGKRPDSAWDTMRGVLPSAALGAIQLGSDVWRRSFELLVRPGKLLDYGRQSIGMATELAKLIAMPQDSPTCFKGKPGTIKRVAWADPLPLPEVKAVGKALACSVNDVLLATVAGALRRYLAGRGEPVDGVEVRALVPVNLRDEDSGIELGNWFGLVTLLLPVYEANSIARVLEVHRRMEELKSSYQAPVALGILASVGVAPKAVQEQFLDLLSSRASAVMTNVPGPQVPLYLAGARLRQVLFWVPQSGDVGMGVSILSYNGAVQFGVITDRKLVPDPHHITSAFCPEFEKLVFSLLLEPPELPEEADRRAETEPGPTAGRTRGNGAGTAAAPADGKRRLRPTRAAPQRRDPAARPSPKRRTKPSGPAKSS